MSEPRRRSRAGRPIRRAKRWFRHTPTAEVAQTLIVLGVIFVVAAVILAITVL